MLRQWITSAHTACPVSLAQEEGCLTGAVLALALCDKHRRHHRSAASIALVCFAHAAIQTPPRPLPTTRLGPVTATALEVVSINIVLPICQ